MLMHLGPTSHFCLRLPSTTAAFPYPHGTRTGTRFSSSAISLASKKSSSSGGDENDDLLTKNYDISDANQSSVRLHVIDERQLRTKGLIAGISFFSLAILLGLGLGFFNPLTIFGIGLIGASIGYFNSQSYNEYRSPLPSSSFEVRKSTISSAGMGLFAGTSIAKSTYLFDYEGEVLDEIEYFDRYPNGDGRYVARVDIGFFSLLGNEPIYIDGIDPEMSNAARYMNSASGETANILWKKQQFGKQAGSMHFYTSRDIQEGEELFFDYGENYWEAADQIDSRSEQG